MKNIILQFNIVNFCRFSTNSLVLNISTQLVIASRKKTIITLMALFFLTTTYVHSQSCFNFHAANDTTISCLVPCPNIKVRIPDLRSPEDYKVISIPYDPYPFVSAVPAFGFPCNQDDRFGPVTALPFNFCFYGNVYTQYVLGSNGVLTFDTSNALKGNNFEITSPIPFIGTGTLETSCLNNPAGILYPKLAIMGAYQDLFPDINDPVYKIESRVEGFAPLRKFVISYSQVKFYQCQSSRATFEVVLHEGTGFIDVFIKDQSDCGGNIIIGIQRDGLPSTPYASPPGRNLFSQTVTNEGWRFVPNGASSQFVSVVLYKNGIPISTGTTINLGNGELEATFQDICQTEDSMSYIIKALYKKCDNPAIIIEGCDTIIVYKTLNPLNINVTDVKCFGTSTGNITVTSPVAPNIEYSVNGGVSWQSSPSFNVPAGNYIVKARILNSICGGSKTVSILEPAVLTATSVSTNATCFNNGTITVTALGGTQTYQYSIDGVNFQVSNVFNVAPSNYTITVKDNFGCSFSFNTTVGLINILTFTPLIDRTICEGTSSQLQLNSNATVFSWTPSTGLSNSNISNPQANPVVTTQYVVTAILSLCSAKDTVIVNVNAAPIPNAGPDGNICLGLFYQLQGSGGVLYSWSPSIYLDNPNIFNPVSKPDKPFLYTLSILADSNGCASLVTDRVLVYVKPIRINTFPYDTVGYPGEKIPLLAIPEVPNVNQYNWTPSTYLNNPVIPDPIVTVGGIGSDVTFKVTATATDGCVGEGYVHLKVYNGPEIYVPSAFTPNNDGMNDTFYPYPVGIKAIKYFRVFNRWGNLVFQTNNWKNGWDGKYKGNNAPAGVYVWMVEGINVSGRVIKKKGTVMLIR